MKSSANPLRAVSYLRLSIATEASTSIVRQRQETRERCGREGWELVAELEDPNISGAKARENAATALAMLREGRADVLIVAAFDRWSRQGLAAVADLITVLDEREKAGHPALFVAIRDGLTSAMAGWRIVAVVIAEIARQERETTSARTTASIARLTAENRWRGGTVPYGYRAEKVVAGSGYRLVLDEPAAAVMREAARRLLSGVTAYAVVRDLNRDHGRGPLGGDWRVSAFIRQITSPRMVGRVIYQGEVVRGPDGLPAAVWPPVLDVETWQRLRALLGADRPGERPRPRRAARLLSGLVTCHDCGANLHVNTVRGNAMYQCTTRQRGSARCQKPVSVRADKLEDAVERRYLDAYGDLPAFERVETATEVSGLAEIERAIKAVSADLQRDADLTLYEQLRTLQDRRNVLKATPAARRVAMRPTGLTHGETWKIAEDVAQRRALLAATYLQLSIGPATRTGRNAPVDDRITVLARPVFVVGSDPDQHREGAPAVEIEDDGGPL